MTVGEIRRAIEGLPDDARILLMHDYCEGSEGIAVIQLRSMWRNEDDLVIDLEVTVIADPILDDDGQEIER